MEAISWSSGEKSEKSFKKDKPILNDKAEIIDSLRNTAKYISRKDNRNDEQKKNEIIERYLIRRTYQNPFLGNKDYINVIEDQQKYLTPLNSNFTS